jgi:hypothetical protein
MNLLLPFSFRTMFSRTDTTMTLTFKPGAIGPDEGARLVNANAAAR